MPSWQRPPPSALLRSYQLSSGYHFIPWKRSGLPLTPQWTSLSHYIFRVLFSSCITVAFLPLKLPCDQCEPSWSFLHPEMWTLCLYHPNIGKHHNWSQCTIMDACSAKRACIWIFYIPSQLRCFCFTFELMSAEFHCSTVFHTRIYYYIYHNGEHRASSRKVSLL